MKLLPSLCIAAASLAAAELHPAMIDAAKSGNKASLRALIQQKSDVNAADPDGSTALHWAAHRDDLESVDALLKAGANANAANDLGTTPLWLAAENGSLAVTKRLLDAGARGTFHFSNEGEATWYELAAFVLSRAVPGPVSLSPARAVEHSIIVPK